MKNNDNWYISSSDEKVSSRLITVEAYSPRLLMAALCWVTDINEYKGRLATLQLDRQPEPQLSVAEAFNMMRSRAGHTQ